MNIQDLMSGIAVVIDDKLDTESSSVGDLGGSGDLIVDIVEQFRHTWNVPFFRANAIPAAETWPHLLQSAGFILLDWQLWPLGSSQLERDGIEANLRFLRHIKDHSVPVFIFSNASPVDIADKLSEDVYPDDSLEKSFVFIRKKAELLLPDGSLNLGLVQTWLKKNASVYALKTWDQMFRAARTDLFGSMHTKNPDWPRVFWREYEKDGVDPSVSLTHMINDSLRGRMRADAFETEVLGNPGNRDTEVSAEDVRSLISAISIQEPTPEDEIRCGDLFKVPGGKFLLNIRPDCDCIPRNGTGRDDVRVYCIEGKKISETQLGKKYHQGQFTETIGESIVFTAYQGKSLRFDFKKLKVKKFGKVKKRRIGRVMHPYLTRIQQRYALFLQRQGLPRIPPEAVAPSAPQGCASSNDQ